jgi:multidrug efflux pump subunit AcrA (membrane-fusion protein)
MPTFSPEHRWLHLQCQTLTDIKQAVLLRQSPRGTPEPVAFWPDPAAPSELAISLAQQALTKGHLTVRNSAKSELVVAYPLALDHTYPACVVITLTRRERALLATTIKRLKVSERWYQLLADRPAPEPTAALAEIFTTVLHEPTLTQASLSLVNQLAHWLGCEQVALGLMVGKTLHVQALSHSAGFDARTRAHDLLKRAMQEAAHERTTIATDAQQGDAYPQHQDLREQVGALSVESLPLLSGRTVVGVLNLQWHHDPRPQQAHTEQLQQQLPRFAALMALKQRAEPSAVAQINARWGKRLYQKQRWALAVGLLVGTGLLAGLPVDYRVSADAQLQGEQKNTVVAQQDGFLAEVMVRPGDRVALGAPLARLDERELRLERRKLASQLQQYRQEYDNALASSERASAAVAAAQAEQVEIQLELIEHQLQRTLVRAPIKGVIVSDDISQAVGKPLTTGEVLFEVAAINAFRVILYVDERDIVRIEQGQTGELVLSSLPAERLAFTVSNITPVSEVSDGRNRFRVEAQLSATTAAVQPGMTGTAKITVGREPLGWVWLHPLLDWLRLKLWW